MQEKHLKDKNYPTWRIVITGAAWHAIAQCEDLEAEWECREHWTWLRDNMEPEYDELNPLDIPAFLVYYFRVKMMLDAKDRPVMTTVEQFQPLVEVPFLLCYTVSNPKTPR